ncbi:hypothetical protein HQ533_01955 [Candidatus Woesearchaeota archaeon]|nr:hypothetical protein [Candidatus Woesearchaeota archaeon]
MSDQNNSLDLNSEQGKRLTFMIQTARRAGEILKSYRPGVLSEGEVSLKDDGSKVDWVTDADFASEKHIFSQVNEFDPEASQIGEEDGRVINNPNRFYITDPLDGTGIFSGKLQSAIKNPQAKADIKELGMKIIPGSFNKYCVFLSYVVDNEPQVEVAYAPEFEETVFAVKDFGTFYQTNSGMLLPLSTLKKKPVSESVAGFGFVKSVLKESYLERYAQVIEAFNGFEIERTFGFTSSIYECMAPTFSEQTNSPFRTDVYMHNQIYLWDLPSLLISEVGGKSMMIQEQDGKLEIGGYSHSRFKIDNPNSEDFKEPYAIVTGNPWLVDEVIASLETRLG